MSVLSGILKTFVGDKAKKDLKGLYPLVDKIHQATAALDGLTNDQLRDQTNTFKKEIAEIQFSSPNFIGSAFLNFSNFFSQRLLIFLEKLQFLFMDVE